MEYERDGDTNYNWSAWTDPQKLGKGRLRIKYRNRDHPNTSIVEIGQNTKKSPGDLRRLAVTQTPVKDHQLTLVWKTRKEY